MAKTPLQSTSTSATATKPYENPWILAAVVTIIGFFTYFKGYSVPAAFFWDENYHVASAQKYLNHVHFMEQHPPFGKLLIALGERLLHANSVNNQYIGTDYATNPPDGFSFRGYRFFPVLLAWLAAPLFFGSLYFITRKPLVAFLFSGLYLFDNALIVHMRGAMLEGPMLFLCLAIILEYFVLREWAGQPRRFTVMAAVTGATFGLLLATKLLGLITVILLGDLAWRVVRDRRPWGKPLAGFVVGFLIAYVGVWQTHFTLGRDVNASLSDQGYYKASAEYRRLLSAHYTGSLFNFPTMWKDSLAFVPYYNRGVPKLNLCKSDENGSPFFLWPFGGRAINYRWETPNSKSYQYLFLQSNPTSWLLGLLGVVSAFVLIVAPWFLDVKNRIAHRPELFVFLAMYAGYMFIMARLTRVMYLYHYFLPLLFSFILFVLVYDGLERAGPFPLSARAKQVGSAVLGLMIFGTYLFYSPLTYYRSITDAEFKKRMWLGIWDLRPVHGERTNGFASAIPPKAPIFRSSSSKPAALEPRRISVNSSK